MEVSVGLDDKTISIQLGKYFDLSVPVSIQEEQIQAFYLPKAEFVPVKVGTFVGLLIKKICKISAGDTREGGSVNCEVIKFCPHGNGTHTECIGHITKNRIKVHDVMKNQPFMNLAWVISVTPVEIGTTEDKYPPKHETTDMISFLSFKPIFLNQITSFLNL
jgi:arylformamidase